MKQFTIRANDYLSRDIKGFYHTDYIGYKQPGNPDYINILKNTFNNESGDSLSYAIRQLKDVLFEDLPKILDVIEVSPLTVCVVPRAKTETTYAETQLLFKATVRYVVNQLDGFVDGAGYIVRVKDTKTTHLAHSQRGAKYAGEGDMPYVGITKDTCFISDDVRGKDVLLIDDVYTLGVNVDEDAIQALLDKGAKSVHFYAVGKTVNRAEHILNILGIDIDSIDLNFE